MAGAKALAETDRSGYVDAAAHSNAQTFLEARYDKERAIEHEGEKTVPQNGALE